MSEINGTSGDSNEKKKVLHAAARDRPMYSVLYVNAASRIFIFESALKALRLIMMKIGLFKELYCIYYNQDEKEESRIVP
jgi:hypothetical protein